MVVVKGLNLEAIRTLGKTVTFCNWKNKTVAKSRVPKRGPGSTPWLAVYQNRVKIACYYLKTLSPEMIDLFKKYVEGTDWTWKDAFFHFFLNAWKENNAPPLVLTEQSFEWTSPIAKLNFKFADWYYGFDFGYGTDGYGTCPYGTPTTLTENQPHEIIPKYEIGYYEPLGKPYKTFYGSPRNPGCIRPQELHHRKNVVPEDYYTPDPVEIRITPNVHEKRSSGFIFGDSCEAAWYPAWDKWKDDPIYGGVEHVANWIESEVRLVDGNNRALVQSNIWTYDVPLAEYMDPWNMWSIDHVTINLDWHQQDNLSPWQLYLDMGGPKVALVPGVTPVEIPGSFTFEETATLTVSYDEWRPDTPCSPTRAMRDQFEYIDRIYVHWKPRLFTTSNRDLTPPPLPFGIKLAPVAGVMDIIGGIIDLLFPV